MPTYVFFFITFPHLLLDGFKERNFYSTVFCFYIDDFFIIYAIATWRQVNVC